MYLEIYDESANRWMICCPFNSKVYINTEEIKRHFKSEKTLFILATQHYRDYTSLHDSLYDGRYHHIFVRDVGVTQVQDRDLPQYLKAKGSCILTRFVSQYL